MKQLQELIAELEKLEGPSREMADQVLLACGWRKESCIKRPCEVLISPDGQHFHTEDERREQAPQRPNPLLSIDRALTLVPPGLDHGLQLTADGAFASVLTPDATEHEGASEHGAIALCIANLKARLSSTENTAHEG